MRSRRQLRCENVKVKMNLTQPTREIHPMAQIAHLRSAYLPENCFETKYFNPLTGDRRKKQVEFFWHLIGEPVSLSCLWLRSR